MNIFERASRRKLRFDTVVGLLATEQLWELPLTAKGERPDLDKLAREVSRDLREMDEGSFVKTEPNENKIEMELRLEILKHVIDSKVADLKAREQAIEKQARRQKLMAAMVAKDEATLQAMSKEELEAELAKLDA